MQIKLIGVFQSIVIWIVLIATALFLLNLPVVYEEIQQVCNTCSISVSIEQQLEEVGWTVNGYSLYLLLLPIFFAFGCLTLGLLIFRKRSNDPMGLLVTVSLATFGLTLTISEPFYLAYPIFANISSGINFIALFLIGLTICYFPDFRTATKWNHFLALAYFTVELIGNFFSSKIFSEWIYNPIEWTLLLLMGGTHFYKYRRIYSPLQQQQIKLPIYAFVITIVLIIISIQFPTDILLGNVLGQTLYFFALSLIPLSFAVAIIRYRLWAIDMLINRTILYGALSGILLAIYGGIIFVMGSTFKTGSDTFVSLVGTIVVAILVQPLHFRLHKFISRLMYGDRQDPYAALVRLGNRLESSSTSEHVLDTIVTSVRDALHLPYVGLFWTNGEVAAESGTRQEKLEQIDIIYQGERIAELLISSRDDEDEWSKEDCQILNDLSRQAGAVVHAVRLTQELQRSRQNLVTARENERRRLRRDLHDGLGPEIAAFSFKVATARHLLKDNPVEADKLLSELQLDVRNAVDLIRRLAHNLRPPALDEYGLADAVNELIRINKATGIEITSDIPMPLSIKNAAVEVAAYRIIQEGLTNVTRHSGATFVHIKLWFENDSLLVTITDNGIGLPKVIKPGVGLNSMRERAEELGGKFSILNLPERGAVLRAELPNKSGGDYNESDARSVS